MPKDTGIGASTKRREDVRFLTGRGRYTDDINIAGQAYVHFLRSDVAHGRINGIDTAAAEAMPGILKVFTARDFEAVGGIPCGWQIHSIDGSQCTSPSILCWPTARFATSAIPSPRWWPRPRRRRATRPKRSSWTSRSCRPPWT